MRHAELALALLLALACTAAARAEGVTPTEPRRALPSIASSPSLYWIPDGGMPTAGARLRTPSPDLLAILEGSGLQGITLAELVDIALRNDPRTRASWARARAAQEETLSRRGLLQPQVDATFAAESSQTITTTRTSLSPGLSLSWLLLDAGGRRSSVEQARHELIAANWEHDAALQDVVLRVQQTYYLYVDARAQTEALTVQLDEVRTNLDAASARHDAGVATIADVLQARTLVAQTELALATARGTVASLKGALAIAVGLPPDTPYEAAMPPERLDLAQAESDATQLMEAALARRPDLLAARSRVEAARSRVKVVESEGRPRMGLDIDAADAWLPGERLTQETYRAALTLRVPLWSGRTHAHDAARARAEVDEAQAEQDDLERDAVRRTWADHVALRTARQRLVAADALLDSATHAREATLGRYRGGVGSLLDVLSVQSALAQARAVRIEARTDWLLALAQLAHDTGAFWTGAATESALAIGTKEPRTP